MQRNISVTAQHIPGRDNLNADCCSRTFNDQTEWSIYPTIFSWVVECVANKPEVDLFASRLNNKLAKYLSWHLDPEAFATNAFTLCFLHFPAV